MDVVERVRTQLSFEPHRRLRNWKVSVVESPALRVGITGEGGLTRVTPLNAFWSKLTVKALRYLADLLTVA